MPVTLARPLPTELWSSFVNNVEGSFRGPAETIEPGLGHNLTNARLAGLRAQAQPNFLRPRAWRTQQRRKGVVHAAHEIAITERRVCIAIFLTLMRICAVFIRLLSFCGSVPYCHCYDCLRFFGKNIARIPCVKRSHPA
jgi:hypothetical protein